MPYLAIAASVSPPPAMENASDRAIAFASDWVPPAKASNSKTPTGPFQTMVPASRMMAASAAHDSGTDIEDHVVVCDVRVDAFFAVASAAETSCRPRTSIGIGTSAAAPRIRIALVRFADQLGLPQAIADLVCVGQQEGVGDASADDQHVDLARQRFVSIDELGRHFRSRYDRDQRTLRFRKRLAERIEFRCQQRTRARDRRELGDALRRRFGTVRRTECIVGIHVAQALPFPARDRRCSFFAACCSGSSRAARRCPARVGRATRHRPTSRARAAACTPATRPSAWQTGASTETRLRVRTRPRSGLPRCEVTITAAPELQRASRIAGAGQRELRGKPSGSILSPLSSSGTLRSDRMKTYLFATSTSLRRRNDTA